MIIKKRDATFFLNAHIIFIVNNLKGKSSRLLKRDFPDTAFNLNSKKFTLDSSYFAGSVGGVTLEILKNYIENQDRLKY